MFKSGCKGIAYTGVVMGSAVIGIPCTGVVMGSCSANITISGSSTIILIQNDKIFIIMTTLTGKTLLLHVNIWEQEGWVRGKTVLSFSNDQGAFL